MCLSVGKCCMRSPTILASKMDNRGRCLELVVSFSLNCCLKEFLRKIKLTITVDVCLCEKRQKCNEIGQITIVIVNLC